ncbi:hypothetical protein PGT21_027848 [Puccinia graminis f. sp. tritici]|uniref:Uncharacterized protein n=1 Tax=Puccinia graminis f. sp. tritici TaxID=56615 RepID=A0A5B0Q7C5_PUCGR|nr:hypothetical protein PGT21_027848 [Puccinia graminis f. sp. tritici]KAA1122385.1 hypothetical protein PGTUg99_037281 [Puccinia graminis f. sp. tritici]
MLDFAVDLPEASLERIESVARFHAGVQHSPRPKQHVSQSLSNAPSHVFSTLEKKKTDRRYLFLLKYPIFKPKTPSDNSTIGSV